MTINLHHGDALDVLRTLPDNSVHSVVTDPPYGIFFMEKKWDVAVPSSDVWAECLRVLKPGGYLLAFASTRTQHRMATRIEDGGFEIQDMIAWIHSGGMPKSKDVAKAVDAHLGQVGRPTGKQIRGGSRAARSGLELVDSQPVESLKWREETSPSSAEAQTWSGWGTALKPSFEPITVARKPREGTVAHNILEHGAGALNIDACRVCQPGAEEVGRWPSNIMTDGSDAVYAMFPDGSGAHSRLKGTEPSMAADGRVFNKRKRVESLFHDDTGSAARFFYCAKVTQHDRHEGTSAGNAHITVKPTALMQYLVRLVTPPGGIVLDPYMGSGSTGKAAEIDGFGFIGVDDDKSNISLAWERIGSGMPLFKD